MLMKYADEELRLSLAAPASANNQRQVAEEEEKVIFVMPVMTDEEVGSTFDGSGRGDQQNYGAKLKLLRQFGRDIAVDTISDAETSVDQLAKNLRSIIGLLYETQVFIQESCLRNMFFFSSLCHLRCLNNTP